jgi:tyrosyl-tRNA synthetase
MTNEERFNLITRGLDEVLTEEELKKLIESGTPLKHYIGFEISGVPHLGSGLALMYKIKDFVDAGVECTIWIADWHTWLNKKLDGKYETISRLGRDFWKEAMIAGYLCVGGDPKDLIFKQGTDIYKNTPSFWATMVEVSQNTTLSRMLRSISIAGRAEDEAVDFAILLYPAMQAADIFTLQANLAHGGMEQRKAHVIAKDVALQIETNALRDKEGNKIKPVALHNHLILGLNKPPVWPIPKDQLRDIKISMKMSKSKPNSGIFIFDTPEEIKDKMNNAFAPEGEVEFNPLLDWAQHLVFFEDNSSLTISRPEKWGGDIIYSSYKELEKDYVDKKLHPQDLKSALAEWIINKLAPARKYFEDPKRKAALEEIEKLTSKK